MMSEGVVLSGLTNSLKYTTQNLLRITFFLVKYFCILRKLQKYFCVSYNFSVLGIEILLKIECSGYFESKAYTKDVMVKNQHFRCYHENHEIEYFQKFRSFMHFNSVCDVPVLQSPPDNASAYC